MAENQPERVLDEDFAINPNEYFKSFDDAVAAASAGEDSYADALKRAKRLSKHLSKRKLPKEVKDEEVDADSLWQFVDQVDVTDAQAMLRLIKQRAGLEDESQAE